MSNKSERFNSIAEKFNVSTYQELNTSMDFSDYYEMVYDNPLLARSAYQRLHDMITRSGVSKIERNRKTITRFHFFDNNSNPIFGLEENLENLMRAIKGAAQWRGPEKRVILLHGPVGSSKSTICKAIKKGLEDYSKTKDGELYTFRWVNLPEDLYAKDEVIDPMHEDPLKLLPIESYGSELSMRQVLENDLNKIIFDRAKDKINCHRLRIRGELNPFSKFIMDNLLKKYNGNWKEVVTKHIKVERFLMSEPQRKGIATFQPKDEKNQDSTELTGDINYQLLGQYGIDSDPRAFSFDGEFQRANRGVLEFIEVLKLSKEFLYDLLGACQERQVKPKKFPQIDIDIALIAHTNNPEYQKLQQDATMEALRDRTIRVDVPYLLRWSDEVKVLKQDFSKDKVQQHIAPHTLEIAALWAVLTRLKPENDNKLSLVNKAKLYDGQSISDFTEDSVKEIRDRNINEGLHGISARYVQNKISNALSNESNNGYVNPFIVLNEIELGLTTHSLINNQEEIRHYKLCCEQVKIELEEILKEEVQKALVADSGAAQRLCTNYIDNVYAYIDGRKVKDLYTGRDVEADERLMRSIEEKINISENNANDFRRTLAAKVGSVHRAGKTFEWDTDPKLAEALKKEMFERTKDTIKLSSLNVGAQVVDPEHQEKIDAIKDRLIKYYGYNKESATDVLNHVSSIFARGDTVS
jgi:serine protein kinase